MEIPVRTPKLPSHTPAPSPLAQAVHRQVHGRDVPPPSQQAGFSFVEVLLGLAVVSVLGVGVFTVANKLEEKKEVRIEHYDVYYTREISLTDM